jgi:hypothetical protein
VECSCQTHNAQICSADRFKARSPVPRTVADTFRRTCWAAPGHPGAAPFSRGLLTVARGRGRPDQDCPRSGYFQCRATRRRTSREWSRSTGGGDQRPGTIPIHGPGLHEGTKNGRWSLARRPCPLLRCLTNAPRQQAPPASTRKNASISASVPTSPSPLKSAPPLKHVPQQLPARHAKNASMSWSVPESPS